jgi:hypothetical protein
MKHEVGRAKSPIRTLPASQHAYGKSAAKDSYNAKHLLNGWHFHAPSTDSKSATDFKKLNKMTLKEAIVSPKEVADFRKLNDAKIPKQKGEVRALKINLPHEEFSYGIPNKPSTPMDQVVSFEYAARAVEMNKRMLEVKQRERDEKKAFESTPKQTKSLKLLTESAVKKKESPQIASAKVPFKMSKFKDVQSKVSPSLTKLSSPLLKTVEDPITPPVNIQV